MCTNVYIGANTTCIEIPVRYDGDIFVIALSTDGCSVPTEPILGLTTYQYFAGVEGCGCGFAFYEREDRGVCIEYDKSHRALAKYVASCLKHVPFVELFSCWSGEAQLPVKTRRNITLAQLRSQRFYFSELELTTVWKNKRTMLA